MTGPHITLGFDGFADHTMAAIFLNGQVLSTEPRHHQLADLNIPARPRLEPDNAIDRACAEFVAAGGWATTIKQWEQNPRQSSDDWHRPSTPAEGWDEPYWTGESIARRRTLDELMRGHLDRVLRETTHWPTKITGVL